MPEPEYPDPLSLRRVQISGEFYWKHTKVFLVEALAKQTVGLEPIDERYYRVYSTHLKLGIFDSHSFKMLCLVELAKLKRRWLQQSKV